MPLISKECKPVMESYICDECGTGHLSHITNNNATIVSKFEHQCSNKTLYNCKNVWLPAAYPRVIFTDAQK